MGVDKLHHVFHASQPITDIGGPGGGAAQRLVHPSEVVSENALRGHLLRSGFSTVAVGPAIGGYMETYEFLRQEGATESHGQDAPPVQSAPEDAGLGAENENRNESRTHSPASQELRNVGSKLMSGERVVFVEESGPSQYLKVIASGDLDATMMEALEDYIKRQRKRLNAPTSSAPN